MPGMQSRSQGLGDKGVAVKVVFFVGFATFRMFLRGLVGLPLAGDGMRDGNRLGVVYVARTIL